MGESSEFLIKEKDRDFPEVARADRNPPGNFPEVAVILGCLVILGRVVILGHAGVRRKSGPNYFELDIARRKNARLAGRSASRRMR